ncbi:ankyrin repeat domain-containing protein [Uliginosibacterium sp. H1]|uniref:ankyrin repeat domain-containing protein n=1 Tax=Uliginosibacterium sp. H1 TaxID=3114757 RepID=UPI002E18D9AF|nr:ankyrin repeat domain-containing protein [Uliginosibacterium sp. H1]
MSWRRLAVLSGACLLPALAVAQDAITRELEAAAAGVVAIEAQFGDRSSFGAGVVVARERDALLVVTANHVLRQGRDASTALAVRLKSKPDLSLKAMPLPQMDVADDLALLRVEGLAAQGIDPCALPAMKLERPTALRRGHAVYPLGNPAGVAWRVPVRADVVTKIDDAQITFESALIENGHSGGGLFNAFGDLVGIIRADQPPYGIATRMDRVAARLKAWGRAGTDTCTAAAAVPAATRPSSASTRLDFSGLTAKQWGHASAYRACTEIGRDGKTQPCPEKPEPTLELFNAIQRGDVQDVRRLLDLAGFDAEGQKWPYPLHLAAGLGQVEVMKLLLQMGAKKNTSIRAPHHDFHSREFPATPLYLATRTGQHEAMRLLIRAGASMSEGEGVSGGTGTPLCAAARNNQIEEARVLITAGAPLKSRWWDHAPMACAVAAGHVGMVRLLDQARAPLDGGQNGAIGLLRLAAENVHLEVMRYLVSRRVPLECPRHTPCDSPLYVSLIKNERLEAARLLLDAGADPNAGDYKRPLQLALEFRNVPAMKLLLKAGADPNLTTREGQTLLAIAQQSEQDDAVALLRAHGAKR